MVIGQTGSHGHVVQSRAPTEPKRDLDHVISTQDIRKEITAVESVKNHSHVTKANVQVNNRFLIRNICLFW